MADMACSKTVVILRLAIQGFLEDRGPTLAASIAYSGFLSLFPLILLLIAAFGQVLASPVVRDEILDQVLTYLPGARDFVSGTIEGVVRARGAIGLLSAITLLFSASGMFGAASQAVNDAWKIRHGRPFLQQYALNLGLVLGVGIFFFLSMGLTAFFRLFSTAAASLLATFPAILVWGLVGALFPFFFSLGMFLIVYKVLPYTWVTWREALFGAFFAALLFEVAKNVFAWYTQNLANYNAVYGSVGTVVVLLTWIYFSAIILVFGAEISSEYAVERRASGDLSRDTREAEERLAISAPEGRMAPAFILALWLFTVTMTIIKSIARVKAERGKRGRLSGFVAKRLSSR
ncbi:MAG TPA: YihY/virulence factor BrkB family protein [Dehalococcoidia bacterium]|nr:YihY/virulence factor BrkB family protein [Dehalococcoidia bacterium]